MSTYRLIVSTSSVYDVKANTPEDAERILKEKLEKENPREIFRIQVVEEGKIE